MKKLCVTVLMGIISIACLFFVIKISITKPDQNSNVLNEYGVGDEQKVQDEQKVEDTQVISKNNKEQEIVPINEKDKNIIAYITIEKIGLKKAPIADGTDSVTINSYVGHFKESSYLDGNVCLCSHNRGGKGAYFGKLKNLQQGDIITYLTKFETKKYKVKEVKKIKETDLSVLEPTEHSQITLLTCVENEEDMRLCVIGEEI